MRFVITVVRNALMLQKLIYSALAWRILFKLHLVLLTVALVNLHLINLHLVNIHLVNFTFGQPYIWSITTFGQLLPNVN